jgi:hypothetical protein
MFFNMVVKQYKNIVFALLFNIISRLFIQSYAATSFFQDKS